MKTFFADLFTYSHFMNDALITTFLENKGKYSVRAEELLNHIMDAHHIWNFRIEGKPQQYTVWKVHALEDLKFINRTNFEISSLLLDTVDLQKKIEYTNTKGQVYPNTIQEILFHVINHSTHHRAQIATELKICGVQPPVTDYIAYKR